MPSKTDVAAVDSRVQELREMIALLKRVRKVLAKWDEHTRFAEVEHEWSRHDEVTYIKVSHYGSSLDFVVRGPKSLLAGTELRRAIGGKWEKSAYGESFRLLQTIGSVYVEIIAPRDAVCTKRVTGTKTVTLPAVEAQPERTEEREIVEWDCGTLLSD